MSEPEASPFDIYKTAPSFALIPRATALLRRVIQ